jgi:hypothetical protein
MRDEAIRNVHTNVVFVDTPTSAFAEDGTQVTLDEAKIAVEIARLQADYDSQEYARKRQAEYPTIEELVVALYDTDDKAAIEKRRSDVKAKYPKPS